MSKLHDMKKNAGVAISNLKSKSNAVMTRAAGNAIGKFIGMPGMKFQQALSKEDPEKVRGFLEELANDLELPLAVRQACRQLLDGMKTGKPIEQVMQEKSVENIQQLESELEVSLKEQRPIK